MKRWLKTDVYEFLSELGSLGFGSERSVIVLPSS